MKYIYKENKNILNILGNQEYDDNVSYRLCHCVLTENVDKGTLLYNNITKAFVLLNKTETQELNNFLNNKVVTKLIKNLISKWFVVQTDFDEIKTTDQLKDFYLIFKKQEELNGSLVKGFTFVTTTDCNARCFYCFEHGCAKTTMNEKTINDVVNYIIKNISPSSNKKLRLSWFGGEPLLGEHQTDEICTQLRDNGIDYTSTMISNGYLFDDALIKKAKNLWHLERVQITLDGTENCYNKIKNYIYKDDSNPFERVIQNIEKLVKNKIATSIRLNLSPTNYEDIENLIIYLSNRFKKIKSKKNKNGVYLLSAYTHTIFQELDKAYEKKIEINDNLKKIYARELKFEKLINELGLSSSHKLPRHVSLNYCMADSNQSEIILPDGKLGICEHYVDGSNTFSDIYSDKVDQDMLNQWKEKIPSQDICKTCAYYPSCMHIKKCPNSYEKCYEEFKNYNVEKMRLQMRNEYSNYKKSQ